MLAAWRAFCTAGAPPPLRACLTLTFEDPPRRIRDHARTRVKRRSLQRQGLVADALEHQLALVRLKLARADRHHAAAGGRLQPRALHADRAGSAARVRDHLHRVAVELEVQVAVRAGRLLGVRLEVGREMNAMLRLVQQSVRWSSVTYPLAGGGLRLPIPDVCNCRTISH